jgi:uncharacterized protein YqjF (DUF2071 family)
MGGVRGAMTVAPPTLDSRAAASLPPAGIPVMAQQWRHLLFLHWAVEPALVQPALPPGLTVDAFEGRAYIGIVPFFMRGVRPRGLPPLPGLSYFPELNLRTYVYDDAGVPGVWFYSLEAGNWLAVQIARTFFRLPYFHADMPCAVDAATGTVSYASLRDGTAPAQGSRFVYRPVGPLRRPAPETLAYFLVERYVLYAQARRGLARGRVHHAPYAVADADVPTWDANLFALNHLPQPAGQPDHVLYSPGVAVDVYALAFPPAARNKGPFSA